MEAKSFETKKVSLAFFIVIDFGGCVGVRVHSGSSIN